ncbi:MAG: hypothetical protein RIC55_00325 [Pirellulaceae bacterium]
MALCKPAPRSAAAVLLLGALVLTGCQHTHYEVELVPEGDSVQRKITAWRERQEDGRTIIDELPAEELTRLATAYGEQPPPPASVKHTFGGRFSGELPGDLGGKGWYVRWETPLGSTSAYSERVRGDIDLAGDVADRQKAAEELADLIVGWAETEFEDVENFAALRKFLDIQLRRDLQNLSLYWWTYTTAADGGKSGAEQAAVRMTQYLAERGYYQPSETPHIVRAVQEASQGKPYRVLHLVQQQLARRLGRESKEAIPEPLQFLADPEKAQTSIVRYLESSPQYQATLEQWRRDAARDPESEPPAPQDVLTETAARAFPLTPLLASNDELTIRLTLPHAPISANGQWSEEHHAVVWSRDIPNGSDQRHSRPTQFYAFWSEPRAAAQEAVFGRVVLDGKELGEYCLWYAGLSDDEAQQWDAFLATLRAGDALAEKIGTFRFSNEPPYDALPNYEGHAQHAIDVIRRRVD